MKTEKLLWHEYEFPLPKQPEREEILHHDKPKAEQYWRKPRIPTDASWSLIDEETRFKLVARERVRRKDGVWFYNNGVPTYITGKHYDHLVYGTFDYKLKYLDTQRHDFYFREILAKDKKTYGGLIIKPRRYGYTDMEVSDHICTASDNFNAYCGLMSDTREKVYTTLYDKITASYIVRPKYCRPDVLMRNGLIPKRKMEFQSGKVAKAKSENDIAYNMKLGMKSKIVPKALSVMGYDGDKLHKLTLDEIWKWTKVSPKACWNKQKKCLFDGGNIIGKAMLLSTMGDDESYERAIREGIEMWHESNPFERDANGFTKTGLYRYFVPGWAALFGKDLNFCDKYGFIDVAGATQYILNERAKYDPNSLDYTFEVRKYPLTIEEALGSALTTGVFDKKRGTERITIIKAMKNKPYMEGKLTEDNMGKIHFEPDSNEPWLVFNLPSKPNRFQKIDNRHIPPHNPEGVFGYDPIRYMDQDTTSKSKSEACIIGRFKFDYYRTGDDNVAGQRSALYLHRPDDADEGHYECIKAAKLWGHMVQFERQVETFLKMCRLSSVQMLDFLLRGPDGNYGIWTDSQRKVIKSGVDRITARMKQPKSGSNDIDWLALEPFIPWLEQFCSFDPQKTTKFDGIMGDIMLEDGLTKIHESLILDPVDVYKEYQKIQNSIAPKRNKR